MEDAVGGTNRRLAVTPGIPSDADAGLDVGVVVLVHVAFGVAWPNQGEREGRGGGVEVLEDVGEVAATLKGNSIELVTEPVREGDVPANLPAVLREDVVLVLNKFLVVRGLTCSRLVEELRLKVAHRSSNQHPGEILNGAEVRGRAGYVHRLQSRLSEAIEKKRLAGIEIVEAGRGDIAEVSTELQGMVAFDVGDRIGVAGGSGMTQLRGGVEQRVAAEDEQRRNAKGRVG